MSTLELKNAKAEYVDGKLVIESEELAQMIQDTMIDPNAEEAGNAAISILSGNTVHIRIGN